MSRFAPVAPPSILRALREFGPNVIGRYHLLLAHDVASNPKDYENLFPDRSFIIMDNSVIELGSPVEPKMMREACRIVKPNVIVLPDVIHESRLTIDLTLEFLDTYATVHSSDAPLFMSVPQGRSLEELQECAIVLARASEGKIGCWGVGRFITEGLGSRKPFTEWLASSTCPAKLRGSKHGPFIHLLGFSENMEDDIDSASVNGVLGIDSAVPVRLGQQRQVISRTQNEHIPRGNWWEEAAAQYSHLITAETIANLSLIRGWINFGFN